MPQKVNEGKLLKDHLKVTDRKQADVAALMGMQRNGFILYLKKESLPDWFKQKLKGVGIDIFEGVQMVGESAPDYARLTNIIPVGNDKMIMMVPLVPQYAYAGYTNGYADAEYIEKLEKEPMIVDRAHKGNYLAFEVRGDSMNDGTINSYEAGWKVYGREIPRDLWHSRLHLHRWSDYIIVMKDEGIIIKRIVAHDIEKGIITLHSLNPKYTDFSVPLDDVVQLFNVVQVVRNL